MLLLRKEHKTLKEIGKIYGVSKQRIQQITGKAGQIPFYEFHPEYRPPDGMSRCYLCKKFCLLKEFLPKTPHRCKKCQLARWRVFIKNYDYSKEYLKGGKFYKGQRARSAVFRAVANGKLQKKPCEVGINCFGRIEAHHYLGYEKKHWLDVKWLCSKHHAEHDKLM